MTRSTWADEPHSDANDPQAGEAFYTDPDRWVPRLLHGLERQLADAIALEAFGDTQSDAVVEGESERVLEVLAQRQEIIDRMIQLDSELEPIRAIWNAQHDQIDPMRRAEVVAAIAKVEEVVARVQRRDESDSSLIKNQCVTVKAQMRGNTSGRSAVQAYAVPPGQVRPAFQDREV